MYFEGRKGHSVSQLVIAIDIVIQKVILIPYSRLFYRNKTNCYTY